MIYKRISLLLLFNLFFFRSLTFAGPGDTTTVQAFTFGSPQEAKFKFPDASHRFSKILMEYTLKCNPAQVPACGEWDYLTYTFLYKHTGKWDSTRYSHPNFTFNGQTPDSLMYMNNASLLFQPWFEYSNYTLPSGSAISGDSSLFTRYCFGSEAPDARSQFIFTAAELSEAGLLPGQLTGMRFNFSQVGGQLSKLRIRIRQTTADTLNPTMVESQGFTEVYKRDRTFTGTGWQTLPFTYPFSWDGSANLLVDISYESRQPGGWNENRSGNPGTWSLSSAATADLYLKFRDMDYVEVPAPVFSTIDSSITIAFWQYGDPLLQPQDNTIFEGLDSAGRRVVNVHLPWSNGRVYWDAGNDSTGYDRINQVVGDPSKYRGKWNHWAFSKDAVKGRMRIYLNGQLFFMQGSRHRAMDGIVKFRIGSDGSGTGSFYDGFVDEFTVWDKVLSDTAIRAFMYKDLAPDHPDYPHLRAYYKFNADAGLTAQDHAPGGQDATLGGYPEWRSYKGGELFRNFSRQNERPCVVFEQGSYNPATLDSTLKIDTLQGSPIMIVMYGDTLRPYLPTDTLTKFPAWYTGYQYDPQGHPTDSALVQPDAILHRKDYTYYGKPFEILERYELARYITPYGNNLSLGNGWTWVFDLTDYAPLLRDSVHLSAGNWQELLDMKFRMVEGIPPRDVKEVTNIYTGTHGYADAGQHNLPPVKVAIGNDVRNARLKMRITGHGFGGTDNCSEFCPRENALKINGMHAFNHLVWRNDCGLNPLYPQGGTWLYDRAEWCPGAEVRTKNFELSRLIVPGDSLTIDYDLQPGYTWDGQGSWPYYAIESQLITYGNPNFRLDVAMEEVLAPNNDKFYGRFNPLCGRPWIAVKNNGSDTLANFIVDYGPAGGIMQSYIWNGKLAFQDTVRILLPSIDWSDWTGGDNRFGFRVRFPNGSADENNLNDSLSVPFVLPPTYENQLILKLKTNHMAASLSWVLTDEDDHIVYQNPLLINNTIYQDTFNLPKGCYRLSIRNAEGEGLSYWANMPPYGNGTSGYAQLKNMAGQLVKSFQGDFGRAIGQSFTVGMSIDVPELNPGGYFSIYPNPTPGKFDIAMIMDQPEEITVVIHDAMGHEIHRVRFSEVQNTVAAFDLTANQPGLYIVSIITKSGVHARKIVKY